MTAAAPQAAVAAAYDPSEFNRYVMTTYGRFPIEIVQGKGSVLVDANGKEYLDFVAGIATCSLGHAHPKLIDAVTKQMMRVNHVSNLFYIKEQGDLAKRLVDASCCDKAFFCNSGGEANEAALKLVRKYTSSVREIPEDDAVIITALSSFHGRTIATITATGQPKYQKGFGPLPKGFDYATFNDPAALRAKVAELEAAGKTLAGIMLEPVQGEGGVKPATAEYLQAARQICDEKGAVLVFDEVQVGIGRTGKMFGYQGVDAGVEPDVITLAKGLGGGIPIGAMLCKEKYNVFRPGDHAATFGGNFLSCAAALAVLGEVESPGFLDGIAAKGERLRSKLAALETTHAKVTAPGGRIVQQVRGCGLLNGVVLGDGLSETAAIDVTKGCIDRGLLVCPAGPSVVRFVPPLIITDEQIDQAVAIFKEVIEAL